ncbi:MAG: glycosyltransferase [Armatimonadetes bacterium]|nr:glycosyltransferase [Armatimonadota bacterium]
MTQSAYAACQDIRGRLGMVVPAWFPTDTPQEQVEALLRATLSDFDSLLEPERLVVVVDGQERILRAAGRLRPQLGPFHVVWQEENRGKAAAVVAGIRALLPDQGLEYIMTRDADGDHFMNDAPHLFRLGLQMSEETENPCVAVIGRRTSVHRPLGWVRGEYEYILNELLIEGFKFTLARTGHVLDTRYFTTYGPYPDMQSGYKLYSRQAAEKAASGLTRAQQTEPRLDMMRWGCEIVPMVEIALTGGLLGEITRLTFYDQPVTSYGKLDRPRTYGAKAAWAFRRMALSPLQAAHLMANAFPRHALYTDPTGREELAALWSFVLQEMGGSPEGHRLAMPMFC